MSEDAEQPLTEISEALWRIAQHLEGIEEHLEKFARASDAAAPVQSQGLENRFPKLAHYAQPGTLCFEDGIRLTYIGKDGRCYGMTGAPLDVLAAALLNRAEGRAIGDKP